MIGERILIVDNEAGIRELIAFNLEQAGMSVFHADSGKAALDMLSQLAFSLVILDIMMDGIDGLEVLRTMRLQQLSTPVILLSARYQDFDKIHGLQLGADDYVTKPFSPLELVARVQAHIRRSRHPAASAALVPMQYGSFRLDPDVQILYKNQTSIQFTVTECMLLQAFMKQPEKPVTKIMLYRQVWGQQAFDENKLNVGISRLRQKIEDDPKNPKYIHTIWGLGYRFTGD